jgi:hypothetical protein
MRVIFVIFLSLSSAIAQACFAPRSGPEYDALIDIQKLEEPNTYQVTVPSRLEDLQKAEIMLAYSKDHAGGVPVYDPFETLKAKEIDGKLSATFTVERRESKKPYIVVMWWPKVCCPCGIQANTKFLEVE